MAEQSVTNTWDDVVADLITTNEIGDGTRDYREENGALFLDCYDDEDLLGPDNLPIPSRVFRIDISVQEEPRE